VARAKETIVDKITTKILSAIETKIVEVENDV